MSELSGFGVYLRRRRQEFNISQEALAAKIGMSRTYMSRIETEGNPTFDIVEKIAAGLGISLRSLFTDRSLSETTPPAVSVVLGSFKPNLVEHNVAIPIITNELPFMDRKLTDDDCSGFFSAPEAITPRGKVVAWKRGDDYVVVDIGARSLVDGRDYIIVRDGKALVARFHDTPSGNFFEVKIGGKSEFIAADGKCGGLVLGVYRNA